MVQKYVYNKGIKSGKMMLLKQMAMVTRACERTVLLLLTLTLEKARARGVQKQACYYSKSGELKWQSSGISIPEGRQQYLALLQFLSSEDPNIHHRLK